MSDRIDAFRYLMGLDSLRRSPPIPAALRIHPGDFEALTGALSFAKSRQCAVSPCHSCDLFRSLLGLSFYLDAKVIPGFLEVLDGRGDLLQVRRIYG